MEFLALEQGCKMCDMANPLNMEGCSKGTMHSRNMMKVFNNGAHMCINIYIHIYFTYMYFFWGARCELAVFLAHSSGSIRLLTANSALTAPFFSLHPCGLDGINAGAGRVIQAQTMLCDPIRASLIQF